MTTGIYFLLQSLFFAMLLSIVYFNKKRIENVENKIYSNLIIISLIELALELVLDTIMPVYKENIVLSTLLAKTYCATIMIWLTLLISYITTISLIIKQKEKYLKSTKQFYIVFTLINILAIYLLPLDFFYNGKMYYAKGTSVNIDYITSFVYVFIGVICLIWNRENIKNKKYLPLFMFMLLGGITGYIQMKNPELLLSTAVHTFITFIMYFTIENPDLQMVEELNKNRKLTEKNFEEKSNFLFKISQDLKKPLLEISEISNNIVETTKGETKEQAIKINTSSKQLYTYVNSALDVTNMDIKNLKIINTTYNTKNFFEELRLRIKKEINNQNKNIEFRYEISENIPELLSGDKIKLKQIILSIIFDSIKHTEKGFIELNINSIVKYEVCRLIIEISDSGCGMGLEKINRILNTTEELTPEEIEKVDKLNINLPLAHKIIKTINGNFIIKSEVKKGTNFLIIIDQKIDEKTKTEKEKTLENYTKKIVTDNKVLLVSIDEKTIEKTTKTLNEESVTTINALYGKDCINKLKEDIKYKAILIEDELKNESGIEILKELKELNIKIPTLIIINENKKFMAKHYIEDGFDNYIIKEKIEDELKKINKYI